MSWICESDQGCRKIDNWGGGGGHIHLFVFCPINFFWNWDLDFKIDCLNSLWTRIYEYVPPPPQLSIFRRPWEWLPKPEWLFMSWYSSIQNLILICQVELLVIFYASCYNNFRFGCRKLVLVGDPKVRTVKPVFHLANLFARTAKEATWLAGDKHWRHHHPITFAFKLLVRANKFAKWKTGFRTHIDYKCNNSMQ